MQFIKLAIPLSLIAGCSKDLIGHLEGVDHAGPKIYNAKWIDHPSKENGIGGDFSDGGNYVVSIGRCFQLHLDI